MSTPNTNYVTYLIELSQSGRRNAYKDLCEINLRHVYTIVYHLIPDESTARKITQQVFLVAYSELKNYNPPQPFASWIKKIAIHYTVKILKYDTMYQGVLEKKLKNHSGEKNIEYYLCNMNTDNRIILVLNDIEGLSHSEIQSFLPDLIVDEIKSKLIEAREYLISNLNL